MSLDPALILSIISTLLAGAAHARFHLKSRCCGQIVSVDLTPTPIKTPPQTVEEEAPAETGNKKCSDPSPSSVEARPPSSVRVAWKP